MSVRGVIAACIAGSLTLSSTAAAAAPSPPPQVNPWAVLTALSGGPAAAAMCGSAATTAAVAAAAQPGQGCVLPVMDAAPTTGPAQLHPVPEPLDALTLGLLAIIDAGVLYLAVHAATQPNSPA